MLVNCSLKHFRNSKVHRFSIGDQEMALFICFSFLKMSAKHHHVLLGYPMNQYINTKMRKCVKERSKIH